jgi:hypothetical protein
MHCGNTLFSVQPKMQKHTQQAEIHKMEPVRIQREKAYQRKSKKRIEKPGQYKEESNASTRKKNKIPIGVTQGASNVTMNKPMKNSRKDIAQGMGREIIDNRESSPIYSIDNSKQVSMFVKIHEIHLDIPEFMEIGDIAISQNGKTQQRTNIKPFFRNQQDFEITEKFLFQADNRQNQYQYRIYPVSRRKTYHAFFKQRKKEFAQETKKQRKPCQDSIVPGNVMTSPEQD